MHKKLLLLSTCFLLSLSAYANDKENAEGIPLPSVGSQVQPRENKVLIEENFSTPYSNVIRNLLNSLYANSNYEDLLEKLPLIDKIKEEINRENILLKLLDHRKFSNFPYSHFINFISSNFCPSLFLNKIREDIGIIYVVATQNGVLHPSYYLERVKSLQKLFNDELTTEEKQQLGIILCLYGSEKEGVSLLKEIFKKENLTPYTLISAYMLDLCEAKSSPSEGTHSYVSHLKLSPEEKVTLTRDYIKSLAITECLALKNYMCTYILSNLTQFCEVQDYLNRDLLNFEAAGYKYQPLNFPQNSLLLLKDTFSTFNKESLKEFYKHYAGQVKKSEPKKGIFALYCRSILEDLIENKLDIVNYHSRYMSSSEYYDVHEEEEKRKLFSQVLRTYQKNKTTQMPETTYHLARSAFFIVKRDHDWKSIHPSELEESIAKNIENYSSLADTYFSVFLDKKVSVDKKAKAHYYLGLNHLYRKEYKEAVQNLNEALFHSEFLSEKKILQAKRYLSEISFKTGKYLDYLHHSRQLEISSEGLSVKEELMKILCLHKLSFKEAEETAYQKLLLLPSIDSSLLLDFVKNSRQFEEIKPIYKLAKDQKNYEVLSSILRKYGTDLIINGEWKVIHETSLCIAEVRKLDAMTAGWLALAAIKLGKQEDYNEALKKLTLEFKTFLKESEELRGLLESVLSNFFIVNRYSHSEKEFIAILEHLQHQVDYTPSPHILASLAMLYYRQGNTGQALKTLERFVTVKNKNRLHFKENYSAEVYKTTHETLVSNWTTIMDCIISQGNPSLIDAWIGYFKEKGISLKVQISEKKAAKKKTNNLERQLRKHVVHNEFKKLQESYILVKQVLDKLSKITSFEWEQLEVTNNTSLLQEAEFLKRDYDKYLASHKEIAESTAIDAEEAKKAFEYNRQCDQILSKLRFSFSGILEKVERVREQQHLRNELQEKYQLSEISFTSSQASATTTSSPSALKETRQYLKLMADQQKQKQILQERRQQLRAEKRKEKQRAYNAVQQIKGDAEKEQKFDPNERLITHGILPVIEQQYSLEDKLLLHKILSVKFELSLEEQETLRVILTGGERAFQINNADIKKVVMKFEGFAHKSQHGRSHDRITGMGLTFMPNADGIKKGSYYGQIKQVVEKIIQILVPTLTVGDLSEDDEERKE